MKKFLFILVLLLALILSVNAAEGDYIIKYRADVPRFYLEEDSANSLGAGMYLVSKEEALALKDAGMLEICEPDGEMTYYDVPANDTYYSSQYNLPMIKAPYAWSFNTFGDDVLVAVIDSGLAKNHPDIDYSRVVEGYNFGAIPSDSDYETNRFDTTDVNGHGTMVSGVIAAKRNNSQYLAGIADKVKLLPIKIENKQGGISTSSVITAINFAWDYHGCDVINLSLGQPFSHPGLEEAVKNAINKGCIVVCAVGNDTKGDPGDHLRYPASYPGVIGVASVDRNYSHVESSVVNESVYVSAPAHGIPVLHYQGGYTTSGGTSFASPQIAAVAAIAKSVNPDLTPQQFADILKNTAYRHGETDLTAPKYDTEIGYGLVNVEAIMKYMLKDRKTYISPIAGARNVTVFNLTNSEITLTSILASYYSGKMVQYDYKPITIAANGYYIHSLTPNASYNSLTHFLWDSLKKVSPYDSGYTPRQIP